MERQMPRTNLNTRPPLTSWLGGKRLLAKEIINRFPDHACYVEPFAGAAWVLFRKEESKVEVINDINKDIITLYRVVQNHLEEFVRYYKWMLISRDEFTRLQTVPPETLTDIQRSARFYYIHQMSFSGLGRCFGYATTTKPKLNLLRIEEQLSEAHLRLSRVVIECLPYADVIDRYDRPHTLFYVDPPYWNCENDYGKGIFGKDDFLFLADRFQRIKGKGIISLNDTPEIRKIFAAFRLEQVFTKYLISGDQKGKPRAELLIYNW